MPEPKPTDRSERPSLTSDRNLETAVEGTFPASDPLSTIASGGARAVPVERMMEDAAGPSGAPPAGTVTLRRRFPDAEAAKLALEGLVRDAPLDRRCATIQPAEAGAAVLAVRTAAEDAPRIEAMLGRLGPGA